MIRAERHSYKVFNQDFVIDRRFQLIKELGHGAYGLVCAAKYTGSSDGPGVAIKKVTNIFSKKILCKRALRELKLLNHFRGHKNITCLYDMDIVDTNNFNELYLYEELMECDMHQIIRSQQPLTDAHYQSFIYQILVGLKYIHSANVLHRDLKPGNLLVNADCELKICDFGLARGFSIDPERNAGFMTEYVATRWYRAPEIMLSFMSYTKAIDIWSVGCILAELLGGKPIFKGHDYVDQLNKILRILGTPSEETLSRIGSQRAQEYVRSLPYMPKVPFQQLYPRANPEALDLLEKMLAFDPADRVTVEEALEHPYLRIWHEPNDEPVCPAEFDFSFEEENDMDKMRQMILDEVVQFRTMVRQPQESQEPQQTTTQPMEAQAVSEPYGATAGHHHQPSYSSPAEHAPLGRKDSIGIPDKEEFRHKDEPPRPQENSRSARQGAEGLEQELEFGLDGR
ncbi:mitogen-activated protein kinase Slt2p/MPK1 [Trichomonascus vanleenenianus]|uniref:mitogen-activated serine/threonine-protein kinase SLT2 n=1 Tax=Trichomonascus vanleenenianus TaxID=2268995 RepID=UPI003ECB9256